MPSPKLNAFVIQPFSDRYEAVYDLIVAAASKAGVIVSRVDSVDLGTDVMTAINKTISDADFLIVDVSEANPNVMYELGFARSKDKGTRIIPLILKPCRFTRDRNLR